MKTYSDQHGDRFGDRWGQLPKVDGDSWGCVLVHPPVHTSRDTPHCRADPECPRCKETRTFYAHIAPDPQHRAQLRVDREAAGWLQSHPCYLTSAHPRRVRGAAA